MSEPMVSHDAVAFYLLSEQVAEHVKVVQTGQGADEVFAGYDWYPPLAGVAARRRRRRLRAGVLRPPARRPGAVLADRWMTAEDVSRRVRRRALRPAGRGDDAGPGAAAGLDDHAGRRPGQAGRQHDDGLGPGGPRAVPRPRARRARRRRPAGAEARRTAARACSRTPARERRAGRGHRPAEGLLPGAGDHRICRGRTSSGCATALHAPAARDRGLFRTGLRRPAAGRPEQRTAPRWGPTSCGSSACSSSGCSGTASAEAPGRFTRPTHPADAGEDDAVHPGRPALPRPVEEMT